jgi:hypothetical protein
MLRIRELLLLAALLALVLAPAAQAAPGSGPTAVVSLGDSYISGEAGRWFGNSVNSAGNRDGTDRTCTETGEQAVCDYDRSEVYKGPTERCHRSDTAEVLSSTIPVAEKINLACSGGVAKNIWRGTSGGEGQFGEAQSQGDQLLPVAREKDVKLIIVSVGGNDLGFASIVSDCFTRYTTRQGPCRPTQQRKLDAAVPGAVERVKKAIDEIRAVMATAGYAQGDYRLVLQTYPSVIPRAAEARYAEQSPERSAFGCPFYDEDLTWGRTMAAPQIGGVVKTAAAARGTEVLELIDALQGREICAKTAQPATPVAPPAPETSEWGRALSPSTIQQGDVQEVFHPNAYAQRALGVCLTQVAAQPPGSFACTNTPGQGPEGMRVARTADAPVAQEPGPGSGTSAAGTAAGASNPPSQAFALDEIACAASASPADQATATRRGSGLRFTLPSGTRRTFAVDVFQQSTDRRVLGERLVARFRGRTRSFTWNGRANRRGRRATDGMYAVRFRTGSDEGRVAVRRADGRFAARPDYSLSPGCGVIRLFKLERPVLGGRRNRALGIAFRLDRGARATVRVERGGRTVRTYTARAVRARRIERLRLGSERVPRGDVRVILRVETGGTTVQRTLVARRL